MANFPGSAPSFAGFTSSHTLAEDSHAAQHNLEQGEIVALAAKVGTGASTPGSGKVLGGDGSGTSSWRQVSLTTDVTGVLPVASGGIGQGSLSGLVLPSAVLSSPTISGTVSGGAIYTTPTLTSPIIADFSSATHDHTTNTKGGQLPTEALENTAVTPDKLGTGASTASVATSETETNTSFDDMATPGPAVTVDIGANGLALVSLYALLQGSASGVVAQMGYAISGANTVAADDTRKLSYLSSGTNQSGRFGATFLLTGLNAGSTTFTAKYKTSSGTATFADRNIAVVPL